MTPEIVVRDAALTTNDGRVESVDPAVGVFVDHDFGESLITPGFVNAHTHLDLTGAAGKTPPKLPFPDWLRPVIEFRRSQTPDHVIASIDDGIQDSLDAGTTLLGDISGDGDSTSLLAHSPIKARVFRELIGMSQERTELALKGVGEWLRQSPPDIGPRRGVSPHSPYSFSMDGIKTVAQSNISCVAIHVAESADEMELLSHGTGPFVEFLQSLDAWYPKRRAPNLPAIIDALSGVPSLLLIHANYWPADLAVPANATVVYCPRTHSAFGHAPYPLRRFLADGVRVALGTDSLASNPDLSVLTEARFVARRNPDVSPAVVFDMITRKGAEALGFPQGGTLQPGMVADFVALDMPRGSADPLRSLLCEDVPIRAVFCDGRLASGSLAD